MILTVQYMRGVAALMVVWQHAAFQWKRLAGLDVTAYDNLGAAGVDLFFVISGVVMWISTVTDRSAADFMRRRLVRIVPLYWLVTTFTLMVALIAPQALSTTVLEWPHVVASYLFVPWQHPTLDWPAPLLIPGWTLNYEMLFYAIFAVGLLAPMRCTLLLVLGALMLLSLLHVVVPVWFTTMYFWTGPIILEFGFGVLLGRIYTSGLRMPALIALLVVVVGFVAICFGAGASQETRWFSWGVPATLLIGGMLFWERAKQPQVQQFPKLMGDASYSIYLIHVITLPAFAKLWLFADGPRDVFGSLVFMAASVLVASASGIVVYLVLELPMLKLFRRRTA